MKEYNLAKKQFQASQPSWDANYCKIVIYLQKAEKKQGKDKFLNSTFIKAWEDYKDSTNIIRYGSK